MTETTQLKLKDMESWFKKLDEINLKKKVISFQYPLTKF